jgi:hypothetical protein
MDTFDLYVKCYWVIREKADNKVFRRKDYQLLGAENCKILYEVDQVNKKNMVPLSNLYSN